MNPHQFQQLGFNEKEAKVYLALNKIGQAPASVLARLCNLKRTSIYDILGTLLERNLVTTVKQGTHTYYAIDDHRKIYYEAKERLDTAKILLEQLKSEQQSPEIEVNYYKGKEGYIEMYNHILAQNPKELLGWMHLDKFYLALDPVYEENWTKKRIEQNIHVRLLLQKTPLTINFQSKDPVSKRETKFIPPDKPFNTTCFLYENYVTFFDSSKNITGIRIHHPQLYQMQKQIFEMNWSSL